MGGRDACGLEDVSRRDTKLGKQRLLSTDRGAKSAWALRALCFPSD